MSEQVRIQVKCAQIKSPQTRENFNLLLIFSSHHRRSIIGFHKYFLSKNFIFFFDLSSVPFITVSFHLIVFVCVFVAPCKFHCIRTIICCFAMISIFIYRQQQFDRSLIMKISIELHAIHFFV